MRYCLFLVFCDKNRAVSIDVDLHSLFSVCDNGSFNARLNVCLPAECLIWFYRKTYTAHKVAFPVFQSHHQRRGKSDHCANSTTFEER